MGEINDLNVTDASNTNASYGFPENMDPSAVNDNLRALEGIIARWRDDINASTATTGSSNTYAFAANGTYSAYYDGMVIAFDANHTNTGAATLNVDTIGAKNIKKYVNGAIDDVVAGDIVSGGKYLSIYDGTQFILVNPSTYSGSSLTATVDIVATDAGAGNGPTLRIHRDSASPAANDAIGQIIFFGEDSGSAITAYATIRAVIDDPTNTSETGHLRIQTFQGGSNTTKIIVANGIYTTNATGGDQGADTINASAVYDDGVILTTDYVFDMALDGDIDTSAYDAKAPAPRGNPGGPPVHQPARDYKTRHQGRAISMDNAAQYWKTHRRFPNMPAPGDPRLSIGELAQRLLEVCEEQAVLLEEANQRLKALGG